MRTDARMIRSPAKALVLAGGLVPAALLAIDYASGALLSPWRTMVQESGFWAMRFITAGLAVTPLRQLTGWRWLAPLRRTLGHLAALYTALHVVAWTRQYGYDWAFLIPEAFARTYLVVGVIATVLLIPLALTSFDAAIRWLGGRAWRQVHRLVYSMALLAWLHFLLSRARPTDEVYVHAILLAGLMAARIAVALRRRAAYHPA